MKMAKKDLGQKTVDGKALPFSKFTIKKKGNKMKIIPQISNTKIETIQPENQKEFGDLIVIDNPKNLEQTTLFLSDNFTYNGSTIYKWSTKRIKGNISSNSEEICRDIDIVGFGSDETDSAYGLIIEYKSVQSIKKNIYLDLGKLHENPKGVVVDLVKNGLKVVGSNAKLVGDCLILFNQYFKNMEHFVYITKNGWSTNFEYYSYQGSVFSKDYDKKFYTSPALKKHNIKGDIEDWNSVASLLIKNNPTLFLVTGLALSGFIIAPLKQENIWFQLSGDTTLGKTTTSEYAAALVGQDILSFSSTENGFEAVGTHRNHSFIVFDEIKENTNHLVNDIYRLMNGRSKNRMTEDINFRENTKWVIAGLGTGEENIKTHMNNMGISIKDDKTGVDVRAIDISFKQGTDFEGTVRNPAEGYDFGTHINALKNITESNLGIVGAEFLKKLVKSDFKALEDLFSDYVTSYYSLCENEIEKRVARKFAVVNTALVFGVKECVLDLIKLDCDNAIIEVFIYWLEDFRKTNNINDDILKFIAGDIVSKLKKEEFVETDDKFQNLIIQNKNDTSFYGFVETVNDEEFYFVTMDYEKALISNLMKTYAWISQTAFRNLLKNSGYLQLGDKNGNKGFKNTKTHKGRDYLVIKASIENILM